MSKLIGSLCFLMVVSVAWADVPRVVDVVLKRSGNTWRVNVTLEHGDTGWDHYADGWEIRTPDGTELGYRKLHHPHVKEQPFTRSLSGVTIPEGTEFITVHGHDSVHGWSADVFRLDLP